MTIRDLLLGSGMVSALLIYKDIYPKKHSGILRYFAMEYIKPQIFDIKYGDLLTECKIIREESDYDIFYVIDKDEIKENLSIANEFLIKAKEFLMLSEAN